MNYGKRNAVRKQKNITSKVTMQKKRAGVRLFKAFLLCAVIAVSAGVCAGFLFLKNIIDNAPEITPASVQPLGFTTIVYDNTGTTEIERFIGSGANRVQKNLDQIPLDLQHAVVAIEDHRFYEHNGIDLKGIARAAMKGLTSGNLSEGASTITQQLLKNAVFNFMEEKTTYDRIERKLQEQFLAVELEQQMSKDKILENYLNTINLGQNTLGVQAASMRYFGKDVSELNLSESAVIAGITQYPAKYNPITNPEDNAERREKVLGDMLDQELITQAAYDEALADDPYSRIQDVNLELGTESPYTYFVDALAEQVQKDLIKSGYTETQAHNLLYSGGLSIYSTQDLWMQQVCDEELNNDSNFPYQKEWGLSYALTVTRADGSFENYGSGHIKRYGLDTYGDEQGLLFTWEDSAYARIEEWKSTIAQEGDTYDERITLSPQPQASCTVIDQYTGHIKAIVGGRGSKAASRSLNRAYTGSHRQPGSCFKILAAYAPALENGQTISSIIVDEPYTYETGQPVRNWYGNGINDYYGPVTMRKAIEQSMNICAVKTLTELTPMVGYEYCEAFGISTMDPVRDVVQSLALGGTTNGVYNFELGAAYAAIANGGMYNEPVLYTKILDHDGNVLLENVGQNSRMVIQESTAAILTNAMQGVVTAGTGTPAALPNMPVAGKTGTSSMDRDLWFAAYTPYYTCTIWAGYDDNKYMTNEWKFHLQMWNRIMTRLHDGLEWRDFVIPSSVQQKTVCTTSGLLSVSGCPSVTDLFAPGTGPTSSCYGHRPPPSASDGTDGENPDNPDNPDAPATTDPANPDNPDAPPAADPPPVDHTPEPEPEPEPQPQPEPTPEVTPVPDPPAE